MNRIAKILFIASSLSKDEFYKKHNIDEDEMGWLGSGDFGDAYEIDNDKVLKITKSKKELDIAKQMMKSDLSLPGFVKIYDAQEIEGNYYIVMEQVDTDSKIEDLFSELQMIMDEQGLPMTYIDQYLDTDELEITDELQKFITDMEDVSRSYRQLGIEAADIRAENLGYDKHNKLKAFDIFDRA